MTTPGFRRVIAVFVAVASLMTLNRAPAAGASTSTNVNYIAAGGVPIACEGPGSSIAGFGIGGACLVLNGPATLQIDIHDLASPAVVAYVDDNIQSRGFICGSGTISIGAGEHIVGVWVGGANAAQIPSCLPGQATAGTVTFTF